MAGGKGYDSNASNGQTIEAGRGTRIERVEWTNCSISTPSRTTTSLYDCSDDAEVSTVVQSLNGR